MSDEIAQVVEQDVAKPMLKAVEDIGETVPSHLAGIGERLDGAAAAHLENESGIVSSIEGVSPRAAESEATSAAVTGAGLPGDAPPEPLSGGSDPVQEGQVPGAQGQSDDPVDVVRGEMFLPQRDVLLPGVLSFAVERMHRSGYRSGHWFGRTWASTLDQRVEVDADGIHFAAADGVVLHYPIPSQPGQRVLAAEGARWPLTWDRNADTIRIEQTELGRTLHFPPGPVPLVMRPLAAVTDRHGNRVTILHDDEGVPTDVHHPGGGRLIVERDYGPAGPRISGLRLADPAGDVDVQVVRFGYDRLGRLTEVTNSSGLPLVFEYDDHDRVVGWIDRNGHRYGYRFDESGRVVQAEGTGGYLAATFAYDLQARTTTLTDSLGHATVHHWNERGQVVKVVDPLGGQTLSEQDRYNRLLARTDALGHTTRYHRDENGDPVRVEQPDGSVAFAQYNELRLPTVITGPDGATWQYTYDERGNLTAKTEPDGAVTRYGYDERGHLRSIVDPLGNTTLCETDRAGLPVASGGPLGAALRVERDVFGRPVAVTDAAGAVTRFGWSVENRISWREGPDGSRWEWRYDPEGNLLEQRDPAGATTRYEYGPFDRVTARIDPAGALYAFAYDTELRLAEVAGPDALTWRYSYDPCDRLVEETDFNGRSIRYTVDAAGRLVERVNASQQSVAYSRDAVGRVLERRAGDAVTSLSYDPVGRLLRAESPDSVLTLEYDQVGRLLRESIDGRTLTNAYDAAGRRIGRTTPSGVLSEWTYDAVGRPLSLGTAAGALTFQYDSAGREATRFLGTSAALTQTYDEVGRLSGQAVWAYDATSGAASDVADGAGAVGPAAAGAAYLPLQQRGYHYNADGVPVAVTDLLRGDRGYETDAVGRVTAVHAANWAETYAYDALGNLTQAQSSAPSAHDAAARGEREVAGTLTRRAGRTTYEHDADGRVVRAVRRTLSGGTRVFRYVWNAEDRLTEVTTPDGATWRYAYDALGRRTAKRRLAGDGATAEEILFSYEGSRLAEQVSAAAGDGRVRSLTWEWEPLTMRAAAQVERSWALDAPQGEIDTAFYAIVTDLVGAPSELVSADGRLAWYTVADLWGAPIAAPASMTDCPLRFPGQYHDPETGWYYNYERYYDPDTAGYASPDPLGLAPAPNQHRYVANPLVASDPLGLSPYPLGPKPPYEWAPPHADTSVLEPGEAWDPSQGTPVIGRLNPDTKLADTFPGYTKFNAAGGRWSLDKNDAWIQTIIDKRGTVYTVSPTEGNYWNSDPAYMGPTVYAREVQQLLGSGYSWDGDNLVPPAP